MCGIVAVAGRPDAAELVELGLFSLQHRGQESAGLVSVHRGELISKIGMGLVSEVFADKTLLPGRTAVGHVRYATTGDSSLKNAQPLVFKTVHGALAIAHNGNLTNALQLKKKLEGRGAIFQSMTDSEVIVHLLARQEGPIEDALIASLRQVEGAYSLLLVTPEKLIVVRDPYGFRPIVLGQRDDAHVFASETNALNLMGARFVREIAPGEMVVVENGRLRSLKPFAPPPALARCVFEEVYFARPDSVVFGRGVQAARRELGRALARQMEGLKADIVVPVPDSGLSAALGFSQESGIPFELGLMRSHYVSRTFIKPTRELRERAAMLKLAPVAEALHGKRIVLVDDSIVRGTTSRRICGLLRQAGAREIHMAVSSPPIVSPCYYGIDTPRGAELIANQKSVEEIRKYLGVDSLHYLRQEAMLLAAGNGDASGWCTACFSRRYPTPIPDYQVAEAVK